MVETAVAEKQSGVLERALVSFSFDNRAVFVRTAEDAAVKLDPFNFLAGTSIRCIGLGMRQ